MRDGRDEIRLDLFDHQVGGDIAESEDASGDGAEWIAHHRFAQREPYLFTAAQDRHETLSGRGLPLARLELSLQHLDRREPDCLLLRNAGDLLCGGIPKDDLPVAVDRDDPVCDVREDREASLLLEGDT